MQLIDSDTAPGHLVCKIDAFTTFYDRWMWLDEQWIPNKQWCIAGELGIRIILTITWTVQFGELVPEIKMRLNCVPEHIWCEICCGVLA